MSLSVSQTCKASVSQKISSVSLDAEVKVVLLSEGIEEMDFVRVARSRDQGPEKDMPCLCRLCLRLRLRVGEGVSDEARFGVVTASEEVWPGVLSLVETSFGGRYVDG